MSSTSGAVMAPSIRTVRLDTGVVAKHLIDLDEEALGAARAELGTSTIRDTVNKASRRATSQRGHQVAAALDVLAGVDLDDRPDAWR